MSRGGKQVYMPKRILMFLRWFRFVEGLDIRQMAKILKLPKSTYYEIETKSKSIIGYNSAEKIVRFIFS